MQPSNSFLITWGGFHGFQACNDFFANRIYTPKQRIQAIQVISSPKPSLTLAI